MQKLSSRDDGAPDSQVLSRTFVPDNKKANLTPDAVKKLAEKLSEMMGEDLGQNFSQARNERGELVNEDGLPIIDITEPIASTDARGTGDALIGEEDQLPPIAALPPSVRGRWQQERDRILDQLEEEERLEKAQEEQAESEERLDMIRKRNEAAAGDKQRLKAAKEMQKKMGRALLLNMAEARAKEEEAEIEKDIPSMEKRNLQKDSGSKKTVAFADIPQISDDNHLKPSPSSERTQDWGDLSQARLRSTAKPSLLSSSDKLPMKMTVVERIPKPPPAIATTRPTAAPDSDDESEPDDSDHELIGANEPDEGNFEEENLASDEEEFDLDYAQHQREITLQYYEKRAKIGEAARMAMISHSHDDKGDVQVDAHLDMRAAEQDKPPISRFKARHFASSYSAASSSTSLGASVVPASTAKTLQKAIRTGKLDTDNRLVGGDADSASEGENEGMQELLDLLKKGDVYNLGPDGQYMQTVPRPLSEKLVVPPKSEMPSSATTFSDVPPINRPKTSKFKLSRSTAGRPSVAQTSPSPHPSPRSRFETETPISNALRSSPQLPSTPMTPTIVERPVSSSSTSSKSPLKPLKNTAQAVIDTPSFPQPTNISTPSSGSSVSPVFSMIVESPSFPKSTNPQTRAASRSVFSPTVVSSAVRDSAKGPHTVPEGPGTSSRLTRPPVVMTSTVRESSLRQTAVGPDATPQHTVQARAERVSRFMADRM